MPRRGEKERYGYSFEARDGFRERQEADARRKPATGPICPLACNARWRRQQETLNAHAAELAAWEQNPTGNPPPEPEVTEIRPWLGDPILCPRCQSQVKTELAELSDLAALADAENTGHRHGPDADRVSGSKLAPSPSAVGDDLDELAGWLRDWQAVVLGMDETPARAGFLMSEIATLAVRLASLYYSRLMAHEAAADFASETRQWHRRLTRQTKAGTGVHHKSVPCPRCERYSLSWRDGDRYVACAGPDCGRMMLLKDFEEYEEAFRSGSISTGAA